MVQALHIFPLGLRPPDTKKARCSGNVIPGWPQPSSVTNVCLDETWRFGAEPEFLRFTQTVSTSFFYSIEEIAGMRSRRKCNKICDTRRLVDSKSLNFQFFICELRVLPFERICNWKHNWTCFNISIREQLQAFDSECSCACVIRLRITLSVWAIKGKCVVSGHCMEGVFMSVYVSIRSKYAKLDIQDFECGSRSCSLIRTLKYVQLCFS